MKYRFKLNEGKHEDWDPEDTTHVAEKRPRRSKVFDKGAVLETDNDLRKLNGHSMAPKFTLLSEADAVAADEPTAAPAAEEATQDGED